MDIFKKHSVSLSISLVLHLSIFALFGLSFVSEPDVVKNKPLPEIIRASMLDEDKIQAEANRLKNEQKNKKWRQNKKQKALENKRKKEQKLLKEAKKKRLKEEKKAKESAKKRKALAKKELQKLEKIKKQNALESARLAKINKQKVAEKKRLDDLRKAEELKQQELLAKQKAEDDAVLAKQQQDEQATISAETAIRRKVISRWINPQRLVKGLNCTIRVKLLPSGDVMSVSIIRSSGDTFFDRSAENAVHKASPLPVPKDRALFTKSFRTFNFEFRPEELLKP
ncbi:MAG: cell envelope integrity protein TolA [Methylococcales bacterium]|nr:cell envelope integrity protein TolA [Methylococcales bacterium]